MIDWSIVNKAKQLVPLFKKMSLLEFGIISSIIFLLCKTVNFVTLGTIVSSHNKLFSVAVIFSYILTGLGILRMATAIDLSHNFIQNSNKNVDAKFLHLYELKIHSLVQIPFEVVVGIKLFKILPSFFIGPLVKRITFFVVFDYFPDQIDLDAYTSGMNVGDIIYESNGNKVRGKVSFNKQIGKPEFILPILIVPKVFEDGKELFIKLILEPTKTSKFHRTLLTAVSYLLFPLKKVLII